MGLLICDGFQDRFYYRVEVAPPDSLLSKVSVLLEEVSRLLQGLEVTSHLHKGACTCLEDERRIAHYDGSLLTASVTTRR